MGQYSYSQPSSSKASYPSTDDGFGGGEATSVGRRRSYNFGIPEKCFCGFEAVAQTSTTELNPGRIFFGCKNHKAAGHHIFKWWDEAIVNEMKELRSSIENLSDRVASGRIGNADSALEAVKRLEAVKSLEAAVKGSVHVSRFESDLLQMKECLLENRYCGFGLKEGILVGVIIVLMSFICISRF